MNAIISWIMVGMGGFSSQGGQGGQQSSPVMMIVWLVIIVGIVYFISKYRRNKENREGINAFSTDNQEKAPVFTKHVSPLWLVAILAVGVLFFCCKFHVVYGGGHELVILKKSTFTLSESFVSWDEIIGVPKIVAIMRNPLTMKALEEAEFFRE